MERLSFDEQLEDLRDISGTVDDYITRELYVADFGADMENTHNPNAILAECYGIIIDELAEFGITFTESDSELLTDWYTAKHLYYIRAFLDGDNLLRILSVRGELGKLSGMVTDTPLDDQYIRVIDFVMLRKTAEIYDILMYLAERITVTEKFGQHILACIDRITETGSEYNIPAHELSSVRAYIEKVTEDRRILNRLISELKEYDNKYLAAFSDPEIERTVKTYDLDKLSTRNIRKFAVLDNDNSPDQVARKELVDAHHRTTPFHAEYFQNMGMHPNDAMFMLVILAIATDYTDVKDKDKFLKECDECTDKMFTLTTPEQHVMIRDFINDLTVIMYGKQKNED